MKLSTRATANLYAIAALCIIVGTITELAKWSRDLSRIHSAANIFEQKANFEQNKALEMCDLGDSNFMCPRAKMSQADYNLGQCAYILSAQVNF